MAPITVITGGAGFIGSHLAHRLRDEGRRLLLIDDLSTGRRANVEHLLDERCRLVTARAGEAVRDPALMRGVTQIYHLAAAVGVKLVVDAPAAMIRNNIDETVAVLEAAATHDAAVLVTSSSEVYGKCPVLPLREDMDLVYGPTAASRWSYGLTKAIDEHLALDLARQRNLKAVVVRLFNTIGPRQLGRYGMVVPRFVERAVADQPLEIYGDGQQTRSFCDVRDTVGAMIGLMDRPACYGQVFNVGSNRQVSIEGLADRVIALAGSRSTKRLIPYEAVYGQDFEDPPHRLPDLSKIKSMLEFEPKYGLDQTLEELIGLARASSPRTATATGPSA